MQEIEITTRVLESMESLQQKLEAMGFEITRKTLLEDIYMCPSRLIPTQNNIPDILAQSVLIRHLTTANKEYKMLTYKHKLFSDTGITTSEEKISVDIDDVDKAYKLFKCLDFNKLIEIRNDFTVYTRGDLCFAVQNVKDLGLLIEYESEKDYTNVDSETILKAKYEMLKELKDLGLNISDEIDVKKAYELINKKLK